MPSSEHAAARLALWMAVLLFAGAGALWIGSDRAQRLRSARTHAKSASAPILVSGAKLVTTVGSFAQGKMLYDVLKGASLSPEQSKAVAQQLAKVIDPESLAAGDRYEIVSSTSGEFARLAVVRRLERFVVDSAPAGLRARKEPIPAVKTEKFASGIIHTELWASMSQTGLPPAVIVAYTDVFAWTADFLTEVETGDRFALAWEETKTLDGNLVSVEITSAIYEGKTARRITATRFDGGCYDENGEGLRRPFLHVPLNYRRISSGFSDRRFHPILRTYRAHHGTDYAARAGTPVVTIGSGSVLFKGKKGGLGNLVIIQHDAVYSTYYGHLSRFAPEIQINDRVKQGQVIGYVGSTGLATGPHLHFQIMKDGKLVDFLSLEFSPTDHVPYERLAEFQEAKQKGIIALERALSAPAR